MLDVTDMQEDGYDLAAVVHACEAALSALVGEVTEEAELVRNHLRNLAEDCQQALDED